MADLTIGKLPKAIGATQIGDSIITDNGVSGVTVAGALLLGGATSGSVALRVPAIAGTSSITLPSGTTNFTTTGGAGMVLQQSTLGGPITVAVLAPSSLGGLGAGVATWLTTPSSANLLAAVTDETGSGALVFANSPVLAGNPTAPTPASSDDDTSIATTAYVKAQGYTTGNQSITLSGDVAGVGTTAIAVTLATVLLTPGTFQGLTVNGKGLVTAAVNQNYASVTGGPLTAGSVPFGGAGGALVQDNANLFWDDTNNRLGLGTAAPAVQLDISLNTFTAANGIRVNVTAGAAGMAVVEIIGRRDDANSTFSGRLGVAHRRLDGVGIQTGSQNGILAFGGQWGADTTEQQAKLLYPASIASVATGSFTGATAMPTAMVFRTGAVGDDLRFYNMNYGTERLHISAAGNVGLGNFSPYGHTPQALLHIGCGPGATAATVRSYNVYSDAANGEWCYLGDWGAIANVATFGTTKNGTGTHRPLALMAGGIEALRIDTGGGVVIGSTAVPTALFTIAGTYAAAVGNSITTTMTGTSTGTHYGTLIRNVFSPAGASASAIYGLYSDYTLTSAAVPITNLNGIGSHVTLTTGTTSAISNAAMFVIVDPTMNSCPPFVAFNGVLMGALTHGNGATTGSIANRGINLGAISSSSAGATLTNRAINLNVPSGGASAGSAANTGIYITGNGGTASGSGTVTNWAIFSDSTAQSSLTGRLIAAGGVTVNTSTLLTTGVALATGAGAATGTLTNAPVAGNPTKWVRIDDNGTFRYIPAW